MAELTREYRKAAEQAIRDGDYRRAASIYGRLLRDYRAAAHALLRGGLHHDAAVLLLAKLDDRRGAARAFEAAGEFDRAIELYRQMGEHDAAGDLLRRIGEEDAALAEYGRPPTAGRVRGRATSRPASSCCQGRAGRPGPGALRGRLGPSAGRQRRPLRPADRPAPRRGGRRRGPARAARRGRRLLRRGQRPRGRASSTTRSARLARLDALAEAGEPLRDRALLGLAVKLRQLAKPGRGPDRSCRSCSSGSGTWTAAVSATPASPSRPPPAPGPRSARRPATHASAGRDGSASASGSSRPSPRPRSRARSSSASRGARSTASVPSGARSSPWRTITSRSPRSGSIPGAVGRRPPSGRGSLAALEHLRRRARRVVPAPARHDRGRRQRAVAHARPARRWGRLRRPLGRHLADAPDGRHAELVGQH